MLHHQTLGRNTPQGYVSDLDWEMYCREGLDVYFDGYTVYDAVGTWKSQPEDSKVVLINTDDRLGIDAVIDIYKDMFDQEAVGLFTTPSMEFI